MKKILIAFAMAAALLTIFTACAKKDGGFTPDDIRERGELIVGVKEDVPYFSFYDDEKGDYSGYEIELAGMISEELLGSRDKVTFVPVTTRTRTVKTENGEIDMAIATFSASEERLKRLNFSQSYYKDYDGLLVRADSGIRDISDLDGKAVGVLQGSTAGHAVSDAAAEKGIKITIITYASYEDIQTAIKAGRCDAFCSDRAILKGYITEDLIMTPDKFSEQQYSVVTRKENTELAAYVDELIIKWENDGTLKALQEKYGI